MILNDGYELCLLRKVIFRCSYTVRQQRNIYNIYLYAQANRFEADNMTTPALPELKRSQQTSPIFTVRKAEKLSSSSSKRVDIIGLKIIINGKIMIGQKETQDMHVRVAEEQALSGHTWKKRYY